MALMIPDSDDEFDYDFSAEEEQLLLQLGSKNPVPPVQQPSLEKDNYAKLAIDSVPGQTERVFGDDDFDRGHPRTLGSGSAQTSQSHHNMLAISALPKVPGLEPPASFDQDVSYPDCTWSTWRIFRETN